MSERRLVTCIISRQDDSWQVTWVSDARTPRDFKETGLTESVNRASREIGAIYAGTVAVADAELQFAIYPFSDRAAMIFDIQSMSDGYSASDLEGKGLRFDGTTLELLVEAVRTSFANHDNALFRWVIPMSRLLSS